VALSAAGTRGLANLAALDESRVEVAVQDDQKDLSAAVEVAAFRIAAEATANALRHGNPSRCQVRLGVDDGWLLVEVRDDGVGFSAGSVAGVGLSSMHERVAELGGDITIDSVVGGGTTVRARLPQDCG
jgi:signal transduction histidine kinase